MAINPVTGQDDGLLVPAAPAPPRQILAGSVPGAPGAPSMPVPVDAPGEMGATVTAVKSPTSTGKVETKKVLEAAKAVDKADADTKEAAVKKVEADQELEAQAIQADADRLTEKQQAEQKELEAHRALMAKRAEMQAAADKAESDADAKVAQAKDAAQNWDSRSAPVKILQALIRGASTRDAYTLGQDPNSMPSIRSMDAALAEEKSKKLQKVKDSEEWRAVLKTGNAEKMRRFVDQQSTLIELETNAAAKALLNSEKTDALAMRLNRNDPQGTAYQAAKAGMLAKLDGDQAAVKAKHAEVFAPTVESGGKTVTTTEFKNGKPKLGASIEDVEKLSVAETALDKLRKLKANIDKDPGAYAAVQKIDKDLSREKTIDDIGGIPFVPGASVGKLITAPSKLAFGETAPARLKGYPQAMDIHQGISEMKTARAQGYGGVVNPGDRLTSADELGVEGNTPEMMSKSVQEQIEYLEKKVDLMKGARKFQP